MAKDIKFDLTAIQDRDDIPEDVKVAIANLDKNRSSPLDQDVWIYRWVSVVLGFIASATVIGGIAIVLLHKDKGVSIPDGIVALGSAAVGALAGLLAPTPKK